MKENIWKKYDDNMRKVIMDFATGYKKYISDCKTERECVSEAIELAKAKGYRDLNEIIKNNETLKVGDKVYANNMGKTLALFNIGSKPLQEGFNILGAHVDSPRMDIKQFPLYEDHDFAYLDTHYYGGIKKYQWVAMPLALHGVVVKKDGTVINVAIGDKEDDPVFGITDLLPHLGAKQLAKKAMEVIEGEDLNLMIASIPDANEEKDGVKKAVVDYLKENYDFEEEDFVSAELEVVPAGPAKDFGLDRSMVMGYGHDDRVCAYSSLIAMLDMDTVEKTSVCLLVDKEEVGSIGATGMESRFFENAVAEVMNAANDYSELKLRRALANSRMLSSDVSAAFDPIYPSVAEAKNTAYMGKGLVFNKYTGARGKAGCNDANAEYMGSLRNIMDSEGVSWQTSELGRVDEGGGGTIAYI